jgi:lipoyl(octanoyl) transferase
MALDELLLQRVSEPNAAPATYLRFYQWAQPTLSLGFSQKAERVVDFEFCDRQGISIVRRITGGKAVLHHRELTYAVVSNDPMFFPNLDICTLYRRIGAALQRGFQYLNLELVMADEAGETNGHGKRPLPAACFAIANHHELMFGGRKLVGSAQRRTQTAFLQHGSILVEFDALLLAGALGLRNADTLASQVTDLRSCLGGITPSLPSVIDSLLRGFEECFLASLQEEPLQTNLLEEASRLSQAKYSVLDWSPLAAQPEIA